MQVVKFLRITARGREYAGKAFLDADGHVQFKDVDKRFIQYLEEDGIAGLPFKDGLVYPKDGEIFFKALPFEFKGSYFRAEMVEEVEVARPQEPRAGAWSWMWWFFQVCGAGLSPQLWPKDVVTATITPRREGGWNVLYIRRNCRGSRRDVGQFHLSDAIPKFVEWFEYCDLEDLHRLSWYEDSADGAWVWPKAA